MRGTGDASLMHEMWSQDVLVISSQGNDKNVGRLSKQGFSGRGAGLRM